MKKLIKILTSRAFYLLIGLSFAAVIISVYAAPAGDAWSVIFNRDVTGQQLTPDMWHGLVNKVDELDGRGATVDRNDCEVLPMDSSTDGGSSAATVTWRVQCPVGYVMVGLYDDNNEFQDVDAAKCCRLILQ